MEYKDFLNEIAERRGLEVVDEKAPGLFRKMVNPAAAKRLKRFKQYKHDKKLSTKMKKAAGQAGSAAFDTGWKAAKAGAGFVRKHKKATAALAIGAYAGHRMLRKKCAKKYPPHNEPESYRRCMARLGRD